MLATKDKPEIKQKPTSTPENKEQVNAEEITKEVFFVQAGTYGVEGNAKRVEKKLAPIGTVNVIPVKINGKMLYKVKVGPILEKPIADLALKKVITLGHPDAIILKEGGEISIE